MWDLQKAADFLEPPLPFLPPFQRSWTHKSREPHGTWAALREAMRQLDSGPCSRLSVADVIFLAPFVVGGCAPGDTLPLGDAPVSVDAHAVASSVSLGLVTGGIYQATQQSISTDSDAFFCEMNALGTRWIRIQLDWPDTSDETYRKIIDAAHQRGIRVVALVAGSTCAATAISLASTPSRTSTSLASTIWRGCAWPATSPTPGDLERAQQRGVQQWLARRRPTSSPGCSAGYGNGRPPRTGPSSSSAEARSSRISTSPGGGTSRVGAWAAGERPFDLMACTPTTRMASTKTRGTSTPGAPTPAIGSSR